MSVFVRCITFRLYPKQFLRKTLKTTTKRRSETQNRLLASFEVLTDIAKIDSYDIQTKITKTASSHSIETKIQLIANQMTQNKLIPFINVRRIELD